MQPLRDVRMLYSRGTCETFAQKVKSQHHSNHWQVIMLLMHIQLFYVLVLNDVFNHTFQFLRSGPRQFIVRYNTLCWKGKNFKRSVNVLVRNCTVVFLFVTELGFQLKKMLGYMNLVSYSRSQPTFVKVQINLEFKQIQKLNYTVELFSNAPGRCFVSMK